MSEATAAGTACDGGTPPDGVWLHRLEEDRLDSLASYKILDTAPEAAYDAAARLAAVVCDTPAAMVSLVDRDRQWLKASYGLPGHWHETARSDAFCSDAVALESLLVVEDALSAPRYARSPLVAGPPGIRSYAGVPLIGRDGLPLGTLCVLGWRPRRFSPTQLDDLAALARNVVTHLELRRADRSLGRDPGELLTDALDPVRLRTAIEQGEFVNRYQPIVDMTSGRPCALEALVRWSHPGLGVIPPALFLPAMERTGLMHALGRSVLGDALDLAAGLAARARPARTPKVAVNLSATQLEAPGLASTIAEALEARHLPADALCVEVTESVPLHGALAADELHELRRLGVGIALDDYGSGTATAGKLLDLPVTALKLDRALATAVAASPRGSIVVRSTLRMAEDIGLDVICEGVETAEQHDGLVGAGATLGQGWLYSPPLGPTHVDRYLAAVQDLGAGARTCC